MKGYNVGPRIRQRLLFLGYQRPNGKPDVRRFCWDHRFTSSHVHAWIANKMTPVKELPRLGDALNCSVDWLLSGLGSPWLSEEDKPNLEHMIYRLSPHDLLRIRDIVNEQVERVVFPVQQAAHAASNGHAFFSGSAS